MTLTSFRHLLNTCFVTRLFRHYGFAAKPFHHIPTFLWSGDFARAYTLTERYPGIVDQAHAGHTIWKDVDVAHDPDFQSFSWMDDLRVVGDNQSRRFIRAVITSWINAKAPYDHTAWRPAVVGERLSQWLHHFEFFGQSADDIFLRLFYKSFWHQFRYLHEASLTLEPSLSSLKALKGVLLGALAYELPFEKSYKIYMQRLFAHINNILYRDGFIHTAHPDEQLSVIKHMIELRNFLRLLHYGKEAAHLQQLITRMVPPLRFFRHSDGRLSFLCGKSRYTSPMVDMVLALSDVRGRHPHRSEEAGIERIQVKNHTLLVRTRFYDYPSDTCGNLQCEWSFGKDRILPFFDLILENQKGHRFQSRSMAHAYRTQADDHAFMELKQHDINHLQSREIYMGELVDLRVIDRIRLNQRGYGALRFALDKHMVASITDKNVVTITSPTKKSMYRLHFVGVDDITLSSSNLLGEEMPLVMALFEIHANSPKEIKWSFSKIAA